MEEVGKKLQAVVPSSLFSSFKQRAVSLGITMQEAIEESARDWLNKTDPDTAPEDTAASLVDSIGQLLQRLRRIV
jgi:hypothetical protein